MRPEPCLAQHVAFEGLGREVTIERDRNDGIELLKLWFATSEHFDAARVKPLLAAHLKAFKKAFGGETSEKEAG